MAILTQMENSPAKTLLHTKFCGLSSSILLIEEQITQKLRRLMRVSLM